VVVSPALSAILRDLLTERRRQGLERGWPEIPELAFCSETGGPLDERNVTRSWHRVRRKAVAKGVRPLRLHDARHTYASLALASGKSVRWVAAQLGHANPELTLRVYAHALREEETDLSFLDFDGGAKRHPRGTRVRRNENAPSRTSATGLGDAGARDGTRTMRHPGNVAGLRAKWRSARGVPAVTSAQRRGRRPAARRRHRRRAARATPRESARAGRLRARRRAAWPLR